MRRSKPILVVLATLAFSVSGFPAAPEPPVSQRTIKWSTRNIKIALSSSVTNRGTSITAGSDVAGALRRALDSWSAASGINFDVVSSDVRSINARGAGDGVNLVTIASTSENLALFKAGNNAAQTRVHFDQTTGLLTRQTS